MTPIVYDEPDKRARKFMGVRKYANALHLGGRQLGITFYPRIRARWFNFEHQHYIPGFKASGWYNITIAHPGKHAWWAVSISIIYR